MLCLARYKRLLLLLAPLLPFGLICEGGKDTLTPSKNARNARRQMILKVC